MTPKVAACARETAAVECSSDTGCVLAFLNKMMMNKQVKQCVSILSLISGARKGKREATHTARTPRLHPISNCVPTSPAQSTSLNPMWNDCAPYGSTRDSSFLELCGEAPRLSVRIRLDLLGSQTAAC